MPNVRSQSLSASGLVIVASDGRTYSVTPAQVIANFQSQTGTVAERKTKALQWIISQMVATLGEEQIDPTEVLSDISTANGRFSLMTIRSRLEVV